MTSPVTFTWETPAKSAVIVFKSEEEKKHQMTKGSETRYTYITTLLPGKYYYYFIIDNKRMIDLFKPTERINNDEYNILTIQLNPGLENIYEMDYIADTDKQFSVIYNNSEQQTHMEIKSANSLISNNNISNTNSKIMNNNNNASNNNKDNQNNHDISNTFSIKKENLIHKINNSDMANLNNNSFNQTTNNKVIVYNYEDQYLIPMEIIKSDLKDTNLIKLKHIANRQDYKMCKDDIFFQKIDYCIINNNPYGNIIEMKEVNELSILKNIQIRLRNNKTYMHIDHYIFACFYYGIPQTDRDFFLSEYLINTKRNQALIIKTHAFGYQFNPKEDNELFIIRKYIEVNLAYHYWKYYEIIAQFLQILSIRMKYIVRVGFNEDNKAVIINFIPSMSSYLSSSDLYLQSILYDKHCNNNRNIKIEVDFINKSFTSLIYKNNPGSKELLMLFNNLYEIIINTQASLLKSIHQLLLDLNLQSKYQNIIKLMVISYIALNYNSIFTKANNTPLFSSIHNEVINEKNMIYYSNIIILVMIKYINHLIEGVLNYKGIMKGINHDIIISYNKTEFDEDDVLFNEVIKKRSMTNNLTDLNKNSISNYFKFYLQENIAKFNQNVSHSDLKLISLIENIYDLAFLSFLSNHSHGQNKKSVILNAFNYSCELTLNIFEEGEKDLESIKQVWRFDLGESFDSFTTDQEKVSHFFQITQIIDYIKTIQGFDINCTPFFRSYTIKDFFNYFLAILPDIDTKYNKNRDYSTQLNKFIFDIQKHLSFKEDYTITPSKIDINYNTFEIIMFLLRNVYEDKIHILQSRIKSKSIFELIKQLRRSTLKLQNAWRRVLFNKYTRMNHRECLNRILAKYKAKDTMLLMYIIKTQKEISSLENERFINNNLNTISSRSSILKGQSNDYILKNNKSNVNMNNKKSKDNKARTANNHTKDQYLTQSSISKKNSGLNTSITRNEINSLKEKLTESREQYKELVNVLVEYEKKLENFIGLINSNQEVKDVLNKNGIQIN